MNDGLTVTIEDGRLVISIPTATLAFCANEHPYFSEAPIKVAQDLVFAKEIRRVLREEQEDGSTLLTNLFDDAIVMAVEDGCEGLHYG